MPGWLQCANFPPSHELTSRANTSNQRNLQAYNEELNGLGGTKYNNWIPHAEIPSLLLEDARQSWRWGTWPRSFSTYQRDGLISEYTIHTIHIFFQCSLAAITYETILECFNEIVPRYTRDTTPFPVPITTVMFQHTPSQLQAATATDLFDLMVVIKHVLYRLRFRKIPSIKISYHTWCLKCKEFSKKNQDFCDWFIPGPCVFIL